MSQETRPGPPAARVLALEATAVLLLGLTLATWFGGVPAGLSAVWPLAGLLATLAFRAWLAGIPKPRLPAPETIGCVGLAFAYRVPALLHPWGWVNRDGAYGAFVAMHVLGGLRPAPPFTEGANYQGTLKAHLAALLSLLSGSHDFSLLMLAASLFLYLVFLVATMSLARRAGGRGAALGAGLWLALGGRFPTVFSLNCVGQYVDVLALGGVALAVLARLQDEGLHGAPARGHYLAIGLLLGVAFWQQPVALAYLLSALLALALRRHTWRDPFSLLVPLGLGLGLLPVLIWNLQNAWATRDVVGRDWSELRAQVDALGFLLQRTLGVSFPLLAGLSPDHPWGDVPGVRTAASALFPAALAAYLALRGREAVRGIRSLEPKPTCLAPLLLGFCLLAFWAVASGRVYYRPRYLLPVVAATAVHLGIALAWLWSRSRSLAVLALGALLALNTAGAVPRLLAGAKLGEDYARLVRGIEQRGIRTGYADFSISAPVTMITAERVVLSCRLGPTPAYESELHERRVAREGPDAFVLRGGDDYGRFADGLRALGVGFRLDLDPVPIFYRLSRRVRLEEVLPFVGETQPSAEE